MINVLDYGASGDGVSDDSAAIRRALLASSGVSFAPGVYVCNGVDVAAGCGLHAASAGVTLLATKPGMGSLNLGASGITLHGLNFAGAAGSEWGVLLDLDKDDLDTIRIEDCGFRNMALGLRVKAQRLGLTLRNLCVRGCTFANLRTRAIDMLVTSNGGRYPYSIDNMKIVDCHFEDIAVGSSGKKAGTEGTEGKFGGAIYIGGLTSVKDFYLCNNVAYRAGPQFVAMSATAQPRENFIIHGNTVKQAGTSIFINMGYTLNGINGLSFSDNVTDFSDYELLFLNDCKNYRVSNCHFSRANVGIAIHERTATAESYGEISNCTFEDIETPSAENNGNKGILIIGDVARPDIINCHFRKRNGTKGQIGIDFNFFSSPSTRSPRLPVQVMNCTFENVTGIIMRSGGNANYPGNAKVLNCNFRKCPVGVSLTYPFGSYIAFCTFDQCDTDVRTKIETMAMRAFANTHIGTNPNNVAGNGAYVIEVGSGKSITQIEACDFRNVKGVYVLALGTLLQNVRLLIWNNNNADAGSSGVPIIGETVVKSL